MELDVVSWNVHGLPRPLDTHWLPSDPAPRHAERVANVVGRVRGLVPKPDVVAFQEVWRDDDAGRIKTGLDDYHVVESPNAPFVRPTGLLTCVRRSRWDVIDATTTEYSQAASVDAHSRKGFQLLTLRDRATAEPLMFLNTHLQSQYAKSGFKTYQGVRSSQIAEMTTEAARRKLPGVPLIAAGDFNTYPYPSDRAVYQHLADGAPWVDLTKQARAACGCETNFDSDHPADKDGWIDYVLWYSDPTLASQASVRLMSNRRIDDPYSDHQGLRAHVSIAAQKALPAAATVALALVTRSSARRNWMIGMAALLAHVL
jgi:endonuclease/exonuclease/phosphatase family metal-dependent hydrolase